MLSYELGTISAGIQDIFKHMLEVYRKYSNLSEYRSNEYSIRDVFNAYHIVKGDFNEIRMARNMYYDIVEKHRKRNERIETIKNKWKDLIANIGVQGKRRSGLIDANSPWVPYNRSTMDMKERELEEEYKKSLRYKKWSEKWDNFIPEVEGVDIDEAAIPNAKANDTSVYDVIGPYEDDFTPETFAFFNVSKKYRKFDLTEFDDLTRRWGLVWYYWIAAKQYHSDNANQRICYFMSFTYLGAMPEIRRYFDRRFLYVNTKEYEIGYLAYDIIYRYQMMIEIFHIMHTKYYLEPRRNKAPVSYMFYMYRNMLEYGTTIIHLCNMMHEIELKYQKAKIGHWDDYPEAEDVKAKTKQNKTAENKENIDDYERRRLEEYKRRRRQRKRNRKQSYINFKGHSTPDRRPKKSFWPLHYGWSIEYW
ncbi:hypothetical protein ABMA27_012368 [Loxostege sticticalis]|uniref:Uncharacterized protein n=1 Tax=Loxostege sticticalis TaxID=481309 RepID=A0ABR3H125_LOXSC